MIFAKFINYYDCKVFWNIVQIKIIFRKGNDF